MKKLLLLLSITIITFSCISTKSTIKNIDNDAVRPPIKNGMFIITEYATDSKYGIDADYPVNIGLLSAASEEAYVKYYFNGLEGPNGEKVEFKKTETCCPFPTEHSNMGAGLLSLYEVNFEGSTKKQTFYFNTYEKGKVVCPKGFSIKKQP